MLNRLNNWRQAIRPDDPPEDRTQSY